MPVDFDDADISDVVEEVNSPQAQIMPPAYTVQEDSRELEEEMSEAEARLEMAQYYRLILNETLFEDAPNEEVATRVEEEIRGFVRERMKLLVGVGQPKQEAKPQKIFTDAEVQALRTIAQPEVVEALKALAAKVLKKPAILDAKPLPVEKPKAEPSVLKEPILKKVGQRRPRQSPEPQAPAPRSGRGKRMEKQTRTITTEDGKEIVQDVTPQARPVGPVQPIPTPRGREQIEAMAAQSAAFQARVALNQLERNLRGKE